MVALHIESGANDIWTHDLTRGSLTRITFQTGEDETPLWMPDGKKVIFTASIGNEPRGVFWKNGDGSGEQELLATVSNHAHLSAVSRDGKWLAYTLYESETRADIYLLPLSGDRKPQVYLKTPFNEREGKISPDGKWMAYASDETGRDEVYVQTIPGGGGKWQVSVEGGYGPLWSPNGKELFFRNENKVMAVAYTSTPTFTPSPPRLLFEGRYEAHPRREGVYDVSADGQRFLMIRTAGQQGGINQLNVVLNWGEELKLRAPSKK
jgi:Tol biopolymer transport system component